MKVTSEINKKIIFAICGASGVIYGLRLLKNLLENGTDVYLIISNAGKQVLSHEADFSGEVIEKYLLKKGIEIRNNSNLFVYENDDFFAPFASGSFRYDAMVIAPCTMGTLGAIASGLANNLILRSADVCLKEKRSLILLPRETPLNKIHIENMLRLADAGATIIPPSPSFYSNPQTIEELVDTVIARVLDHLGIMHSIVEPWGLKKSFT